MKENLPDPNKIFPIDNFKNLIQIKSTITKPNVIVGDFSYYAGENFEAQITHHYDFLGDKLIIGKFCQIAAGVEFVMNGANHQMNAISTFPFYIFKDWEAQAPSLLDLPFKGDTVIGNDVWIGQNAVILAGVKIGDGVIIGANAVVGSDLPPYSVAVGNPAKVIRQRFDKDLVNLLLKLKWWDKEISEIKKLIPLLSCGDLAKIKEELEEIL